MTEALTPQRMQTPLNEGPTASPPAFGVMVYGEGDAFLRSLGASASLLGAEITVVRRRSPSDATRRALEGRAKRRLSWEATPHAPVSAALGFQSDWIICVRASCRLAAPDFLTRYRLVMTFVPAPSIVIGGTLRRAPSWDLSKASGLGAAYQAACERRADALSPDDLSNMMIHQSALATLPPIGAPDLWIEQATKQFPVIHIDNPVITN